MVRHTCAAATLALSLLVQMLSSGESLAQVSAADIARYEPSEVTFFNGDLKLAGQLFLPEGAGPHAAAVLIHGSGTSSRGNNWYIWFSVLLAKNGIAALLPDKRGSESSDGEWHYADFQDLARDAVAGLRFLQGREHIDGQRVGFLGLSQGGHIAPVAGVLAGDVAFVVDISGAAVTMEETLMHELEQTYRQYKLDEETIDYLQEFARFSFDYIRSGEGWETYLARHREITASLPPAAATWPDTEDHWYWDFWRGIYDYDPIPRWKVLLEDHGVPAFVAYGEDDEHDNVPVSESVRRLEAISVGDRLVIHVYPGVGHGIADEERVMSQDFARDLVDWLSSTISQE